MEKLGIGVLVVNAEGEQLGVLYDEKAFITIKFDDNGNINCNSQGYCEEDGLATLEQTPENPCRVKAEGGFNYQISGYYRTDTNSVFFHITMRWNGGKRQDCCEDNELECTPWCPWYTTDIAEFIFNLPYVDKSSIEFPLNMVMSGERTFMLSR